MTKQLKIHWLGAGLSSGPGIRRVAQSGRSMILWNRTLEKAQAALDGVSPKGQVVSKRFTLEDFQNTLGADEVVVSMLPANMHPEIAELCLSKRAHLVTTSYISDPMRAYHDRAKELGLSFVNESGLDPGLDHLMAHLLVAEYRQSRAYSPSAPLTFRSYCGGFPKVPGEFKYKFSWSPVGVLRALKNLARYIDGGQERTAARAWEAVTPFTLNGETFEVYPNRDSIPYRADYGFETFWPVDTFVRGTIRLGGWSQAWKSIFEKIPAASPEELEALSTKLWDEHAYRDGEQDRVVLYVGLEAGAGDNKTWSKSYSLDECGEGRDTAMARLVSLPAVFAIESIESGKAPLGVSGAPHELNEARRWLGELEKLGVKIRNLT